MSDVCDSADCVAEVGDAELVSPLLQPAASTENAASATAARGKLLYGSGMKFSDSELMADEAPLVIVRT